MEIKKKPETLGQIYEKALDGNEEAKNNLLQIVKCIVEDYLGCYKYTPADKKMFLDDIYIFVINFIKKAIVERNFINFNEFMNLLSEMVVEEATQLEMAGVIIKRERKN